MLVCNPAVLPDGNNLDDAPAPRTDPHVCKQVYSDVQGFDEDPTDLLHLQKKLNNMKTMATLPES